MGNLIDDLLGFSRVGRAETNKAEVDLNQLVKEVVAEIGQDAKSRDIAWKIDALPVCNGDRSMLRLVVVNLVSNGQIHKHANAGRNRDWLCGPR
jgi:light-regulated signal transduction histidine kinase (bacteriophytochrome)